MYICDLVTFASSRYNMKLYSISDGPPSCACRLLLKALNIKYELIEVQMEKGAHLTKDYEDVRIKNM